MQSVSHEQRGRRESVPCSTAPLASAAPQADCKKIDRCIVSGSQHNMAVGVEIPTLVALVKPSMILL